MTHHRRGHRRMDGPSMEETRDHIFAAGREILLAARGALSFCKDYVETSVPEASRPNLLSFFQKAMSVADELHRGIASASSLKRTAGQLAKPLFTAIEREMREEKREAPRKAGAAHVAHPKRHKSRGAAGASRG